MFFFSSNFLHCFASISRTTAAKRFISVFLRRRSFYQLKKLLLPEIENFLIFFFARKQFQDIQFRKVSLVKSSNLSVNEINVCRDRSVLHTRFKFMKSFRICTTVHMQIEVINLLIDLLSFITRQPTRSEYSRQIETVSCILTSFNVTLNQI